MSGKVVNNNGELLSADGFNMNVDNRAMRYGDGLFESIKVINGKPVGLEAHLDRVFKGMEILKIDSPESWSKEFFEKNLADLLKTNDISEGGRVRLTILRGNGGYYLPTNPQAEFILEADKSEQNEFALNAEGMTIDLYTEMRKQVNKLASFKTINCLLNIMAALYSRENDLDDCLLQNDKFGIIESSNSNLFIVSNGVLYTPSLDTGCVGGTMRMQIINLAIENGIQVYESGITPQNLLVADELFLTNSISGVRWVGSYKTKRYYNTMALRLIDLLNNKFA